MTTEQCSVDSLLPKNRAEAFARQLQNRLCTLRNGIDRDGPEDTSWNGDQLSSSSDDVYYDLDSSPGSPAEEATETHFTDYINAKSEQNAYPVTSTNSLLNHHENHYSNVNGAQGVSSNQTEDLNCRACTNGNLDDVSIPTSKERLYSSSYQNGLSSVDNYQRSNGNTYEEVPDITEIDVDDFIQTDLSDTSRSFNSIKARLQHNGDINTSHKDCVNNHIDAHENEELNNYNDSCSCPNATSNGQSIDINSNSSANNNNANNFYNNFLIKEKSTTDSDISCLLDDACDTTDVSDSLEETCRLCVATDKDGVEQKETGCSGKYTEEALSRLVDAVFLKSQENDFDSSEANVDEQTDNQNNNEEEETIESKRTKFRRSSSLKTGKTPPGTPGCKKIVRFADVLGLDLADVRTFLDEIPKVPKSAYTDLKDVDISNSPPTSMLDSYMGQVPTQTNAKTQRTIVPLFQQPSSRLEFLDRIRDNAVCLENSIITDATLFVITGYVRVKNIDFHKSVHIRYSIDNWKSFADLQAKYVPNSCDGFSDKFVFVLYAHMLNVGQRLEFAVRYHTGGCIFWDNNFGANYTFQCVPEGPTKVLATGSYTRQRAETWASFY